MQNNQQLRTLASSLAKGEITSVELVKEGLAKAKTSQSAFISINQGLIRLSETIDQARLSQQSIPALAGIPITLKDLFNVKNEHTLAGSKVLQTVTQSAGEDAAVLTPLRAAGLLFLGRTNMSEFAFSGMGLNPHYGTPLSIWDRETGRLPGGSSSGSAVSVAEGAVVASLGTDTAGSCRIPAAFNGIVGVKPSWGRFPLTGIYPLSPSSDAPGPMATDLDSCFILDALMTLKVGPVSALPSLTPRPANSLKIAVPDAVVMDGLDVEVANAFQGGLMRLKEAGVSIQEVAMPVLDQCVDMFNKRSVVLYEAYAHHSDLLAKHGDSYDPFVRARIAAGAKITEDKQEEYYQEKATLIECFNKQFIDLTVDAVMYPTVMCLPPALSALAEADQMRKINLECLRNTSTANYFDGCSISLPCNGTKEAPVGLMLSSMNGQDDQLYQVASTIENILSCD